MPDQIIIWAILCLSLAAVLFLVELFVPSAGLLGIMAAAALISGIVLLFMYDTTVGLWGAVAVLALLPFVLAMAIKVWPHTPIARMLTLRSSQSSSQDPDADPDADVGGDAKPSENRALLGATGKSVTALRPIGACVINGRRVDCFAEGSMIEADTPVRVTSVDGMQIRVTAMD